MAIPERGFWAFGILEAFLGLKKHLELALPVGLGLFAFDFSLANLLG